MRMKKPLCLLLALLLTLSGTALALEPLPMNEVSAGPAPRDECYLSDTEYEDESISVKIYNGRYADTDYFYAHIKISHPSQLRTAPAAVGVEKKPTFRSSATRYGVEVARDTNAVFAINGDYYTQSECNVVLRMGTQVRNSWDDGIRDLLLIDYNGDFSYLTAPTRGEYADYYKAHKDEMYQVMCFGPVLVENGISVIPEDYDNRYIGAQKYTQRSCIAQLGPLEYMVVVCYSDQMKDNKGMTVYEFATLCETLGKSLNENGCRLAFNLDGGNSTTMVFKQLDEKSGKMAYVKVNCPEIKRTLSDIIYFATLVK